MELRQCSNCYVSKPLTEEYFNKHKKSRKQLATECRDCKKAYYKKWQQKNRAGIKMCETRGKDLYTIKEVTPEQRKARLINAYAIIYHEAFNSKISIEKLEKIIDDNS